MSETVNVYLVDNHVTLFLSIFFLEGENRVSKSEMTITQPLPMEMCKSFSQPSEPSLCVLFGSSCLCFSVPGESRTSFSLVFIRIWLFGLCSRPTGESAGTDVCILLSWFSHFNLNLNFLPSCEWVVRQKWDTKMLLCIWGVYVAGNYVHSSALSLLPLLSRSLLKVKTLQLHLICMGMCCHLHWGPWRSP